MDKYGLIGYPLKHSFSQQFFTHKFSTEGIDAIYDKYEIPDINQFPHIISSQPELRGLNVTLPYKEQVMQYLNDLDAEAREIGAVNVIKVHRDKDGIRLVGYNSDIIGFQKSITPFINNEKHRKALILGTGGASKAIRKGLLNLGIEPVYVSRTTRDGVYTYNDLNEVLLDEYKVIVNTTPLGTFPNVDEAPDIPYHLLTPDHLLYDVVYNPAETKFLRQGKEQGATIKNGLEMLELQAIASWEIWNR